MPVRFWLLAPNDMSNIDNGFYRCNNKAFPSKVNALLYSKTINKPIEWVFHDDVYSTYDWGVEPTDSLDELYDRRARELREKYDYLILSFSGGSDTNNILECFIRQGLHIDEIVTNHISRVTRSTTILDSANQSSSIFAAEHELQAIPRLQYIHKHLPKTKITVLDVSDVVFNGIKDDVSWVLDKNDHLSVGQLFRYNYFHFGDMKRQFDKDLRVAIITGTDKPRTYIQDDCLYLYFLDSVANITTIDDFNKEYTNITNELFYWSAETAPMICKQAHVIKRWLEANTSEQEHWRNINPTKVRLYHERILRTLLYSTWDNNWFQADKSVNWWHTEFDTWFRTNDEFSDKYKLWQQGITWLSDKLGNLVETKNGVPDTFVKFRKVYQIGKIKSTLG